MNEGLVGLLERGSVSPIDEESPLAGTMAHSDQTMSDLVAIADYMEEATQQSDGERLQFDASSITYNTFNKIAGIDGTYGGIPVEILSDGQRLLIPTRFTLNGELTYHPRQRLRDIALLLPQDPVRSVSFNPDRAEFKYIGELDRFALQLFFRQEENCEHDPVGVHYGY